MYFSKWTTSAAEAAKETSYVMEHHSYLKSPFDVKKMKLEKENMQLAFKFLKLSPCQMLGDLALQLREMFEDSNGVVILGERCSGKSTIVKLLSKFMEINDDTSLRLSFLHPGIYTQTELYGASDTEENS